MSIRLLNEKTAPYCAGCGHHVVNHTLDKVVVKLKIDPLDLILVSDIGCCGLVDGLVNCHTVHGLHGRSSALGLGISLGLAQPLKKVVVVMGDGGATIGLQHILEAARQNVDISLIVLNNMVYGMTGGQISGLSSPEFKAQKMPDLVEIPSYDICELAFGAGGSFCARVNVGKGLETVLENAIDHAGFSLVEIMEMCPSHGIRKIDELKKLNQHQDITLSRERSPYQSKRKETGSLLNTLPVLTAKYKSALKKRLEVIIAGSAGQGIQLAGDQLASAGIISGLKATKKGEYPITVGTGFSVCEVILAPDDIEFTGIETPDVIFILSQEGLQKVGSLISEKVLLIVDSSLIFSYSGKMIRNDFQKRAGKKGAPLSSLATWLHNTQILPPEALIEAAVGHKHADKLIAAIETGLKMKTPAF